MCSPASPGTTYRSPLIPPDGHVTPQPSQLSNDTAPPSGRSLIPPGLSYAPHPLVWLQQWQAVEQVAPQEGDTDLHAAVSYRHDGSRDGGLPACFDYAKLLQLHNNTAGVDMGSGRTSSRVQFDYIGACYDAANACNVLGQTALHLCALQSYERGVELCIQYGAEASVQDLYGAYYGNRSLTNSRSKGCVWNAICCSPSHDLVCVVSR